MMNHNSLKKTELQNKSRPVTASVSRKFWHPGVGHVGHALSGIFVSFIPRVVSSKVKYKRRDCLVQLHSLGQRSRVSAH